MYEMGPTAACEGCRGEVPRLFKALDILPTGACFFSLLIYPPTGAQWGARAGGLWGGFPNPAKLICMGFAKNGLASSRNHTDVRREPVEERGAAQDAAAAVEANRYHQYLCLPQPLRCLLPSHIPTDRGAVACTGRRALAWISQSRKTHSHGFR
jgi:hypothetical protein